VLERVRGVAGSNGDCPEGTVTDAARNGTVPEGTVPGVPVHIALVAATLDEARRIMVEGVSGILACALPGEVADWSPARRTLSFANGAVATLYSGTSPESLRGPEHDFAWCDELAKWNKAAESWSNLQLGLRRGVHPRVLVTTTPRPGPVLEKILAQPRTVQTGGSTRDNLFLPDDYLRSMEGLYGGTRLGAQELDGVLQGGVEGSLWPRGLIARSRAAAPVSCTRIVIGVDPPASANGTCGIVVCGLGAEGRAYVLADASVSGMSPEGWARVVAGAAQTWGTDQIIVEKNQGGDMAAAVLRGADARLSLRLEHAAIGKALRAEPIALLFERGEAFFAGDFPELEAELTGLVAGGGYQGPGHSPDRADACVWALWALKLAPVRAMPRIRTL
jgi:phage terminase large subunit-like protein